MEKKVNRILPVSDTDTTYFLQITWEKDIGAGFDVMLSDSQSAWAGRVPEEEISREAADMEMEREKYVKELRKVLLFEERLADKYNFDISKEGVNGECLHFSYEKNLKDVAFRLGLLKLQKVSSPAEVIKELISYCLDSVAQLQAKNEHLQKENERLLSDLDDIQGKLQKCVDAKEQLEDELYSRFILVLNEKKAKIRSLQKTLREAEETVTETTQTRDTVTTSESKLEREDYEESTDEESNNSSQPSKPVLAKPRRDSLLNSPDIIDVAPSRKRRQRTRKAVGTEPKVALYETKIPEKEKLDPAPPKLSDKHLSSKGMPLETEKNLGDPEDLFDDI
ncbi:DNA repair protein XRCC4 isoform X2 [Hemicordylus capensis]|nr:DNA repair protein XRCC4 isoform X2 [Hemicordylus capensis]XP_053152210.1 DNA repair protein XRCC4 isoform X2 [Hemicordylus capensis]XP_053152211.1 DNA repair protein XRCC4 isoform X2 [Hemicordylus capensis]XP_053152212.1 DNA repair protein XRCC4 isoform X2 [Hemicordylus capensis]XP_053152213.1 DNA repair protein XRCC4 isoform X2 [Hemicordylus capensis]XP_053152214.1 DNA repair protein XRCC4 isoform X2 [Hemicordylus capensis]XP_053152215.1 DNA repair protein XRCC4 isoform X2 [Hemicordylus 